MVNKKFINYKMRFLLFMFNLGSHGIIHSNDYDLIINGTKVKNCFLITKSNNEFM